MKTCQAFYPIAGSRSAWLPCVHKAERGSHFCRRHGDAIFGALLGALVYAEPLDQAVSFVEDRAPWNFVRPSRRN
jgi:hypothetical protein